ncbi:MAG: ROK family protein [Lachnospiraceae bacterium]|nr:ROK family protein [Lachnospiraceae bacterium]
MHYFGLNAEDVKIHNRALILQLICTNTQVTRHFLTDTSHLTPMTLTNITSDLIQHRIIHETQIPKTARAPGRTPKLLSLSPDSPVVAGIYISKDCLYGILTDMALHPIARKTIPLSRVENKQTIFEKLLSLSKWLVHQSKRPLLGLGVATVGVVDTMHGKISYVTDFYGIEELEITSLLQPHLNIPVFVKNDMQSAALCEMYFGLGRTKDHFIYVGLTKGVGAAIVANRQLLNNLTGSSGELGHTTINYQNGEPCKCGSRGCLEMYVSVPGIIRRINQSCGTSFTDFQDTLAYCLDTPRAYETLENVARQLAYALNNLINLVDISTIIFGHCGVYLPDQILDSIADQIGHISLFRYKRPVKISKSSFGDKCSLLGSVCNVLDQVFTGQLIP